MPPAGMVCRTTKSRSSTCWPNLIGFRVESTAVEVDPDHEGLLRVHSPRGVVGFWLDDEESWYYGWPDPDSPNDQPTSWASRGARFRATRASGTWPFITESVARGVGHLRARLLKSDGGCSAVAVGARADPACPGHRLFLGGEGCRTAQGRILTGPWRTFPTRRKPLSKPCADASAQYQVVVDRVIEDPRGAFVHELREAEERVAEAAARWALEYVEGAEFDTPGV